MTIRKAKTTDIDGINALLYQVHTVHASLRPDLFKKGEKKYTDSELTAVINDENRPIFVYEDDGKIKGYVFCILEDFTKSHSHIPSKSIYIDDLCTDENERGKGIAHALFDYVKQFAKESGCYNITLNVWQGNDNAERFYRNLGMKTLKTTMEMVL